MGVNTSAGNNKRKSWTQYEQMKFYFDRGDFEVLQRGKCYLDTVLKLNRATLDRDLPHLNILPSVTHVITKFFGLTSLVSGSHRNEFKITHDKFESLYDKFSAEVKCYIGTNRYD